MPRTRLWPVSTYGRRNAARARVLPMDGGGDFVLDFTKGQLAGLVFTRASTSGIGQTGCTYINTSGQFQLAGADVPRLNCALGGGAIRGLLVEEQRTNRLLRSTLAGNTNISTPPTGGSWAFLFGTGTSANEASLYGNADGANAIRQTASNGTDRPALYQTVAHTNALTYAVSFLLEQVTSGTPNYGQLLAINPTSGSIPSVTYYRNGTVVSSSDTALPGLIYAVFTSGGSGNFQMRAGLGAGSQVNGSILWSRPQIEDNASRPSSWIPTTSAAVTRPADFASVLLASSKATGSKGTAVIRYYRGEIASKTVAAGSLISGGADLLNIAHHVGGSADATVSDGVTTITQTNQAAGLNRAAASWTSDVVLDGPGYFSLNGAATLDGAIAVPSAATSLAIGRSLLTRHLNGEVAYVALYGDCRTGAALEALAA